MGDLFSGTTKSTSTSSADTGPSKFQAPYLTEAFDGARDNYATSKGTPYYQGETYAGLSDAQKATIGQMGSYADQQGAGAANTISGVGNGLIGSSAGRAADNLSRFTALNGTDPTQANINAAGSYANNPYLTGQIDAASRDVTRNLNENTLPSIDRAASGSGNINSSRAGVASGIAMRGAQDQIGDISASMRGDAYDRGIAQASSDRAAQLGGYNTAAAGYSGMTGQGIDALTTGTNAGYTALSNKAAAEAAGQEDRQGQNDAAFNKWDGEDKRSSDLLARYYATIGKDQWGNSGTSSSTGTGRTGGNIFGQVAGAAATAASFMSDRRLKQDIVRVGSDSRDGLGHYLYRYLWDLPSSALRRGVMADEVAKLRPWALGPNVNGFASVNYDLLAA